jgi:hypothetical protein
MSKSAAARLFGVSLSSVKRYARIAERGESLGPRKSGGRPPKAYEIIEKELEADVHERPAATTRDRCRSLQSMTDKSLSTSTVRRLLKTMGHTSVGVEGVSYKCPIFPLTRRYQQVARCIRGEAKKGAKMSRQAATSIADDALQVLRPPQVEASPQYGSWAAFGMSNAPSQLFEICFRTSRATSRLQHVSQ